MRKNKRKSYTEIKVDDILKGMQNHRTIGLNVGDELFPYTKEDNKTKEQIHFDDVDNLDHL